MASRRVPLHQDDVCWLFPKLTDAAEHDVILQILNAADDVVYRVGGRLNVRPDASFMGVPLNRFVYERLGPKPDLPVTILSSAGWSDQICVTATLAPMGGNPYTQPGPPWEVEATAAGIRLML
jgi:hypothetical protein